MIKTVVRYFLKPKDGRSPYIGENGNWFEWDDPQQKYIDTGRPARGETGKDGTNYLILGWWDDKISYMLSDLGIPVVKVADGTSLGYSAYSLDTGVSTPGASPDGSGVSEWKLVESAEFVYMQDAYIERLQFESALGGGFEIVDGQFQSIAKDTNGVRLMVFDGLTGGGHLAGGNISWDEEGNSLFTGSIQSSDEGNRIIIDAGDRSLKMINRFDKQLVNFHFYEGTDGWGTSYPMLRMDSWRKDAIGEWSSYYFTDYSPFGVNFRSWHNDRPWDGQLNSRGMNISYGWEGTASERSIWIGLIDDQYLEMRMKGSVISNLSLKPRTILGSSSVWLDHWDVFVTCYNSANINVYLPSSPSLGAIKFIRRMNASNVTVMGNGKQISHGNGSISSSISAGTSRGDTAVFFWDGLYWSYNCWFRDT